MQPVNITERKKKALAFSITLTLTAVIIFFLSTSLLNNNENNNLLNTESNVIALQHNKLFQYDEILHGKLDELQRLDEQFASLMMDTTFVMQQTDSMDKAIRRQEELLSAAVDNMNTDIAFFTDENLKNKFAAMVASFRTVITGRQALGSLRNMISIQHGTYTPDEKAMLRLQDELMEKTSRIIVLENSIAALEKNKQPQVVYKNPAVYTTELTNNISELENKVSALSNTNQSLQQENDRLLKQQNETAKNSSRDEALLVEKNIALQKNIQDLNAALLLAHVDCNLSRVDATQIISNSKQRKQLLTEASLILTDLSNSGNADVKKRVKDKIARLNQVAANTRD